MNKRFVFASLISIIALSLTALIFIQLTKLPFNKPVVNSVSNEQALVSKVVDGDTIKLSSGETVRLIGIDTPETKDPRKEVECFGEEAYQKTKQLLENQYVTLEKDVSETDRYKRLLRYVYKDNTMINKLLVEEGYAFSISFPPDIKYQELFKKAQEEAISQKKGLWSQCNK